MKTSTAFLSGVLAAAALAALPLAKQSSEISRLRSQVESLRFESQQLPELPRDNPHPAATQDEEPAAQPQAQEPSRELLRLRGEVARLRQEIQSLQHTNKDESREKETGPSPYTTLGPFVAGIDTNRMPNLPLGSTRDQVLAELQRVNSRLITDQEKYVGNDNYIQALVQTSLTDNATNNKPVTMRMEFYLEHQRLSSQKITSLSFAP